MLPTKGGIVGTRQYIKVTTKKVISDVLCNTRSGT